MSATPRVSTRAFTTGVLLVALLVAGVVSLYASSRPDGLEHVAARTGFLDAATDHATDEGPLAGYAVSGVGDARIADGLAGVIGCAATFAVALGVSRVARRSR